MIMHIFQNLKTYDRPSPQGGRKKTEKEPKSWFDAFKGCLFAIVLFVSSTVLLYGIGSVINSSEIGKNFILIVGVIFILGIVAFYFCTPIFLTIWASIGSRKSNRYLKAFVVLLFTLMVVGLILYIFGSMSNGGSELHEPGKLRPYKF